MKTDEHPQICYMVLIAPRKIKDKLAESLASHGAHIINIMYGKGSASAGYLPFMLGIVPENNKALITCVTSKASADDIEKMLIGEFHFDMPNTGIAFTVPVERLSF